MSRQTGDFGFGPRQAVYTVASLTAELQEHLEDRFQTVRVRGEISNASQYRSGHWYFTLKDEEAQISCVCFRGSARFLRVTPKDGRAVLAQGRIGVYAKRGQYQLIVTSLTPQGVGALQEQFERLKAKLQEEGLFDPGRKRKLPPIPHRIGIVTSPTGAVIADMLRVFARRFPGLHIRLFPVRVQGDGSSEDIAAGVRYFSQCAWPDVVIVGRGGGSLEDLWSFNEEAVARAIAASSVPVVSAVGHETDFTIADFVADLRAPTPSAAAELVVPEASALQQQLTDTATRGQKAIRHRLTQLSERLFEMGIDRAATRMSLRIGDAGQMLDDVERLLHKAQANRIRAARQRCERVERALRHQDVAVRLARQSARLGAIADRLGKAFPGILGVRTTRLADLRRRLPLAWRTYLACKTSSADAVTGRLRSLSPLAVLGRGYSIVQEPDGTAVRDSTRVLPGDSLSVRLHRGKLGVCVEETWANGEDGAGPSDPTV